MEENAVNVPFIKRTDILGSSEKLKKEKRIKIMTIVSGRLSEDGSLMR